MSVNREAVIVSPGEAASAAVIVLAKRIAFKAKEYPKTVSLWGLGLAVSLLATGFSVSQEMAASYETDMARADMSVPIAKAAQKLAQLENQYYYSRGWFSCDQHCQELQTSTEHARRRLENLRKEEAAAMSNIKSRLGVFSEYGVAETREHFWHSFAGGQSFGKRQSMWDLLFVGLSGACAWLRHCW